MSPDFCGKREAKSQSRAPRLLSVLVGVAYEVLLRRYSLLVSCRLSCSGGVPIPDLLTQAQNE
jgi:hypothetical protein